jgi:hypothetical protein
MHGSLISRERIPLPLGVDGRVYDWHTDSYHAPT